jgi:hypothetical protein
VSERGDLSRFRRQRQARVLLAGGSLALAVVVLAGCGASGNNTQPPTPTFGSLEIPDPSGSNNWSTYSTNAPPPEVLPTRGRGVRVDFYAPNNSVFGVSLRDKTGATVATLTENTGAPAPPAAGYFQIVDVHPNANQTLGSIYRMYVRAPSSLVDPANYDIVIVVRTDHGDSNAMVVPLRQRKVFTVTVMVNGSGHVQSSPGGILCGTAPSGAALTQCSYEFGPGLVTLNPNSNDNLSTSFKGWAGNCVGRNPCPLTLAGAAPVAATATFAPSSNPPASSTAAPTIPGLTWIDIPDCATGHKDIHPGIGLRSDSAGYFCCEPQPAGSSAPGSSRCSGEIESLPDCVGDGPMAMLRQPGGCYEVATPP